MTTWTAETVARLDPYELRNLARLLTDNGELWDELCDALTSLDFLQAKIRAVPSASIGAPKSVMTHPISKSPSGAAELGNLQAEELQGPYTTTAFDVLRDFQTALAALLTDPPRGEQVSAFSHPSSICWELLRAHGLNADQFMEQAIRVAGDLTQPIYIGVHSSTFSGAPDMAITLTAIQEAVAESLNGGQLRNGKPLPQCALRFVLLVDGAADALDAYRLSRVLAKASPHQVRLNLALFALVLPAPTDRNSIHGLFNLIRSLAGQTDHPAIFGALIGPSAWLTEVGQVITACQGHKVELFGFGPNIQQDKQPLAQGGQLIVHAAPYASIDRPTSEITNSIILSKSPDGTVKLSNVETGELQPPFPIMYPENWTAP